MNQKQKRKTNTFLITKCFWVVVFALNNNGHNSLHNRQDGAERRVESCLKKNVSWGYKAW